MHESLLALCLHRDRIRMREGFFHGMVEARRLIAGSTRAGHRWAHGMVREAAERIEAVSRRALGGGERLERLVGLRARS